MSKAFHLLHQIVKLLDAKTEKVLKYILYLMTLFIICGTKFFSLKEMIDFYIISEKDYIYLLHGEVINKNCEALIERKWVKTPEYLVGQRYVVDDPLIRCKLNYSN